jgi:hypothetical protein
VPRGFVEFIDDVIVDIAFLVFIIRMGRRAGSSMRFSLRFRNGMLLSEKTGSSLVPLANNSITSPLKSLSGRLLESCGI